MSFVPGALIVDMGQTTQTVGNALKPYGLVYDLVTNFKVPESTFAAFPKGEEVMPD